jgi:hypothetical protein
MTLRHKSPSKQSTMGKLLIFSYSSSFKKINNYIFQDVRDGVVENKRGYSF